MRIKDFKCPRCGIITQQYPAISRADNKTEICSTCGTCEALENMTKTRKEFFEDSIIWMKEAKLIKAVNKVKKRIKELKE